MTVSAAVDTGTPEYVMEQARQGRLSKQTLAQFLAIDKRHDFLEACAAIEKRFTD